MVKEQGKKFNRKGKRIGQPSSDRDENSEASSEKTNVPAPSASLADPTEVATSGNESNKHKGARQGKEKEREKPKRLSGYIFMCNSTTKLDCYQYRVFGLPSGKREKVEQIKPGTKLFLFDFESKLLYGVYEATSSGKMNLEPAAFKGKFPAQVKFKISKECLPMTETTLQIVIKESYTGSKFNQELNGKQVRKLVSLFHPLAASSHLTPPWTVPLSTMDIQFNRTGMAPTVEVPYLSGSQFGHSQPSVEPHPTPNLNLVQHAYAESRIPSLGAPYSRSSSSFDWDPRNQGAGLRMQYGSRLPHELTGLEMRNSAMEAVPLAQITALEARYRRLPLQREAVYRNNVAPYMSYHHAHSAAYGRSR